METAWLKPGTGLKVRFEEPSLGHVPAEGAELPLTTYYRRRIADGDLAKSRRPGTPKDKEAK